MAHDLHEIGFFQFENLVRNRIPFVFLNVGGLDMSGLFMSYLQAGLERQQVVTSPASAVEDATRAAPTKEHAVVVMCADGATSSGLVGKLESAGFKNVFFVKGGRAGLKPE